MKKYWKMNLSQTEIDTLNGLHGQAKARALKALVSIGDIVGATDFIDTTNNTTLEIPVGHKLTKPLNDYLASLAGEDIKANKGFYINGLCVDENIKLNFMDRYFLKKIIPYQESQLAELEKLNGTDSLEIADFTADIYNRDDIVSSSYTSMAIYINSYIGARCNVNSSLIALYESILGKTLNYGLIKDENRKAEIVIDLNISSLADPALLALALRRVCIDKVFYIIGLDKFFNNIDNIKDYVKNLGATLAYDNKIGIFHIENITAEAKTHKTEIIKNNAEVIAINDNDIIKLYNEFKDKNKIVKPKACIIGYPQLSFNELNNFSCAILDKLSHNRLKKVKIKTYLLTSTDTLIRFKSTDNYNKLLKCGVAITTISPYAYVDILKSNVVTNSYSLSYNTYAAYRSDSDIMELLTSK